MLSQTPDLTVKSSNSTAEAALFAALWIPDTGRAHHLSSVALGLQAKWELHSTQPETQNDKPGNSETLWQEGLSFRVPGSDCHLNILILERKNQD